MRYRDARFLPDGRSLLVLSDKSGEVELWKVPANGVGPAERLTHDGEVLRWAAVPSPDGRWIAHHDKNQRLFLFEIANKANRKIDESAVAGFADLRWSPDGKWLAGQFHAIWISFDLGPSPTPPGGGSARGNDLFTVSPPIDLRESNVFNLTRGLSTTMGGAADEHKGVKNLKITSATLWVDLLLPITSL